ncbi:iron-containing alcohol dehydrogenase [Salmonella enterica]|uniref:iron-containing alcohol dehydrogenase n=1 Tax=Salmonella enterica TaxID=28901 RepID=UPI003982AEC4
MAQLREAACDGVVAFGGGSVLDAAKAVALLVTNPDQTLSAMTERSTLRPRLPLIAVPTTAAQTSVMHGSPGGHGQTVIATPFIARLRASGAVIPA